jgi:NAD(P)-dependent dehydrogenase (short-subunit alcohol dehydrogenase family)
LLDELPRERVKQVRQFPPSGRCSNGLAIERLQLDIEDLDSVELAADEFLRQEQRLGILYCNA